MKVLSRWWVVVLALLPLVTAGGAAVWYFVLRPAAPDVPDINEVGGTLLVYEVAPREAEGAPPDLDAVAAVLQRRFHAAGLPHVAARSLGGGQVEIAVPRADDHAGELARV